MLFWLASSQVRVVHLTLMQKNKRIKNKGSLCGERLLPHIADKIVQKQIAGQSHKTTILRILMIINLLEIPEAVEKNDQWQNNNDLLPSYLTLQKGILLLPMPRTIDF